MTIRDIVSSAPIVRYASLAGFAAVCRDVGVDHRALMRRHTLDPALLDEPDAWAPAVAIATLLEDAAATSRCPTFGARMASHRTLSTLGPVSLVLTEEPTLRDALHVLGRFWPAYNESIRLRIVDRGSSARAVIRFELGRPAPHAQAVELAAAVICGLTATRLGPDRPPLRVTFRHDGPGDLAEHARLLGAPVAFAGEVDAVEFDAALIDEEQPRDDPLRRVYALQYLAAVAPPGPEDRLERIRGIVEDLLPVGRCSADRVASALGVDRRTVHRWLGVEHLTFGSLVSQVRRHRAERYLAAGHSITEIAERLGFAEVSSFSRWFAAEYGRPPSRWLP